MTEEQKMVLEFHKKFNLLIRDTPTTPLYSTRRLRERLIDEEALEFKKADGDLVEIADALGDLLYVVYGAAVSYGIDLEPIFKEIHRSNMSKIWPDGTVHKDEHGKVIKPKGYSPANIKEELEKQMI